MKKSLKKRVLSHPLYVKHGDKMRFVVVGGINSVLDLGLFAIFANVLGVVAVGANIISTTLCMMVSFFLNFRFVWRSKKSMKETAPKFVLMSLFTAWAVQSGVIWAVTSVAGDGDLVTLGAKLLSMGAGMICNFLGYRFIFR